MTLQHSIHPQTNWHDHITLWIGLDGRACFFSFFLSSSSFFLLVIVDGRESRESGRERERERSNVVVKKPAPKPPKTQKCTL